MDEQRNELPEGEGKPVEAVQDEESHEQHLKKAEPSVSGSAPALPFTASLQGLTDKALEFLAHASNETLGACLVGLGASTYLVLGRLGLVVIGVAGGVVLHASWEGLRGDDRDEATKQAEQNRKRQAGIEVVSRALQWRSARDPSSPPEEARVYLSQSLDFSHFEPETAGALNTFTEAVIKDYVFYWYGPTLPGEKTFPASCKRTLVAFILSLSGHLERKRPADAFLDFVTNASSIIIVFLNELATALNASPNSPANEAVAAYLELKPDCSLAYMLNQEGQQAKLASAAEDILEAYLDPKAFNFPPSHVFLKEILAQLVLGSTLTTCSSAEWINGWIVYGLEESQTTKEVMGIVDAGVESQKHADEVSATKEQTPRAAKNQSSPETKAPGSDHQRHISKAEEAMDEAMQEAKRLTQLMIEQDEIYLREEQQKQQASRSAEDLSESTTQGAPTPTSSQSDFDGQEQEKAAWDAQSPSPVDAPIASEEKPTTPIAKEPIISFDQMVPSSQPTALSSDPERPRPGPPQLTLHSASVSILDDSDPNERVSIRSKPITEYLIQVEPASSAFRGWMTARKYTDFEILHEVLRRISVITGVTKFTEAHAELPNWKVHTQSSLRSELERYLIDAVRLQPLAECEGMKRFLEKDQGLGKATSDRGKGFGWPTPDAFGKFGGDIMTAFTKAPKQVAGGGKAVFGGVAGLVGGGAKKSRPTSLSRASTSSLFETRHSMASLNQPLANGNQVGLSASARHSQESLRAPARPSLDRRISGDSSASADGRPSRSTSLRRSSTGAQSPDTVASPTDAPKTPQRSELIAAATDEVINLPPPPSEMPADYSSPARSSRLSTDTRPSLDLNSRLSSSVGQDQKSTTVSAPTSAQKPEAKVKAPISDSETSVAVELMFAVVNELYTLSSAWNFRKTLLSAAKNYLLRPGNPQLTTIRDMLQGSLLDENLSDPGMAKLIYKLRENGLPTEEEMEAWKRDNPEKSEKEKEELRLKARNLLVTKGMPPALSSVMGAAASGEALGKVFDCLQIEKVSRGLVFGLMLQALKVITH